MNSTALLFTELSEEMYVGKNVSDGWYAMFLRKHTSFWPLVSMKGKEKDLPELTSQNPCIVACFKPF
jgi:hypothetical protein